MKGSFGLGRRIEIAAFLRFQNRNVSGTLSLRPSDAHNKADPRFETAVKTISRSALSSSEAQLRASPYRDTASMMMLLSDLNFCEAHWRGTVSLAAQNRES